MVEQRPDPESRVMLSDQRDHLGSRLPLIDWRSHEDEGRTMRETARLVVSEFARLGLPAPVLADWVRDEAPIPVSFVDVAHPTGTTRMSDDATKGVVDAQGQVHGIDGLFVTGSSVFPTAGHCNPTQMIVALAIRLADALKVRGQRDTAVSGLRASPPVPDRSPRPRDGGDGADRPDPGGGPAGTRLRGQGRHVPGP
jgi:choline dehydrogenase-like flavoprotein